MKFTPTRALLSLVTLWALLLTTTAFSCSKSVLVSTAKDINAAFVSATPYIDSLLPGSAGKIAQAVTISSKITAAVEANDKPGALALVNQLIPIFNDIVQNDIPQLDAGKQKIVLSVLALADIGLHVLVNHLPVQAKVGGINTPVARFKQQRQWGCDYHPEKCR